ncbi:MAG: DsbA family oxidoreductase [Hyphomicrobiales bacterium]
MQIEVIVTSDFICPWCLIGERRLRKAMQTLPEEVTVKLAFHPFELNPDMPPEGADRKAYRAAKFGSLERSNAMDAQIAAVGRADGIAFNHDRIARAPNTFAAHRLMWLAEREGDPEKLADLLFTSYFTRGRDLSDCAVLKAIAVEAGLAPARVDAFLDGDEGASQVRALEAQAYRAGVAGVPYFEIGGLGVVGAQSPAILAEALRRAAKLDEASAA